MTEQSDKNQLRIGPNIAVLNDDETIEIRNMLGGEDRILLPGTPEWNELRFHFPARVNVYVVPCDHHHFTPYRFDELRRLLDIFIFGAMGPNYNETLEVERAEMFYDPFQDFHVLEFTCNGKRFSVRNYIRFAYEVDGVGHWSGCPKGNIYPFAKSMREEAGAKILTPAE
jgi:hypothetical protein